MTIGIYCIRHVESGKRYIGKSIDIERRWYAHRTKADNRHLANSIKKYGLDAFAFEILESFTDCDEDRIADRELHWIDHFNTCDRRFGYNLRRDSATRMFVHEETRQRQSEAQKLRPPRSPETRAKNSSASREALARPEIRAKLSAAVRASHAKPGAKSKRSAALKAAYERPDRRAKLSVACKARWDDPEHREKATAAIKAALASPEVRARRSAAAKIACGCPERKAKFSIISKAMWRDPAHRAKISAATTLQHVRRRAEKALIIWMLSA
ncbi:GIY-YIG nuclease family protein [Mesorhizobium sp. M0859]|uniref:GIY-YIG nuclease family protein n=1 Tax=Mesorhizobium sp. M0859 TaxID=2957014 RepID=UPI0033384146